MDFKEIEKKYWHNYYLQQDFIYQPDRDLAYHQEFKQELKNLSSGSRILEVACGLRCDGVELALAGQQVYETDMAPAAVAKAKQLYQQLGIIDRGRFVVCDAEHLPFTDNFFAASFIAASFHHLPNPQAGLLEMKRVTQDQGYVILAMEPNSWPYFTVFLLLYPVKKLIRLIHHKILSSVADDTTHGFSLSQLKVMAEQAQLEVVQVKRIKYLSELYESGLRLVNKLFGLKLDVYRPILSGLLQVDAVLAQIPIIRLFNWHWIIILRRHE